MTNDPSTLSLDGSAGAALRPILAAVRVVAPSELATRMVLPVSPLTIGRQGGAGALAVAHPTVSRRHAEIVRQPDGGHEVRDAGSRHGTKVGGRPVGGAPRRLVDGDVVRLGDVFLVYEVGDRDDSAVVDRDALPGDAPAMCELRRHVERSAADPAPVLIVGDTGTGKEWACRELHRLSGRKGPLVAVNCATLSAQLAESQLFGHVKGAFTGATADHDGWFRQADGGTLFLDEIGELPLELQAKLLRTVQDGRVQPLGASRAFTVDARLCAATNRDLAAEVERGAFRRDLLARLAKFELHMPALTARRGDLLAWIERMWEGWFTARRRPVPGLAWRPDAAAAVLAHGWQDNLRGVDRLVHDLALRHRGDRPVEVDQLPSWLTQAPPPPAVASPQPASTRPPVPGREEFLEAWERHGRSVRALARHYDRDRRQIYRWLTSYGVRATDDDT